MPKGPPAKLEQRSTEKQEVTDVDYGRDARSDHHDHRDLAQKGSAPDLLNEPPEFPELYLQPVEEAGGREEFAAQDHESDENRDPTGTRQGGEHQAAQCDDGAEGDQEYPPDDMPLLVALPAAMVTLLE